MEKIYKLKGRVKTNPVNICASNAQMVRKYVTKVSDIEMKVMQKFLPGAITIIFDKGKNISSTITAGMSTVGIRIPNNNMLLELIDMLKEPIVATSCNFAGMPAMTKVKDIIREFENKVECIVDEGESEIGIPSTIIRIENEKVHIIREGPISKEQIESVF